MQQSWYPSAPIDNSKSLEEQYEEALLSVQRCLPLPQPCWVLSPHPFLFTMMAVHYKILYFRRVRRFLETNNTNNNNNYNNNSNNSNNQDVSTLLHFVAADVWEMVCKQLNFMDLVCFGAASTGVNKWLSTPRGQRALLVAFQAFMCPYIPLEDEVIVRQIMLRVAEEKAAMRTLTYEHCLDEFVELYKDIEGQTQYANSYRSPLFGYCSSCNVMFVPNCCM